MCLLLQNYYRIGFSKIKSHILNVIVYLNEAFPEIAIINLSF